MRLAQVLDPIAADFALAEYTKASLPAAQEKSYKAVQGKYTESEAPERMPLQEKVVQHQNINAENEVLVAYISPLDLLDYVGLGITALERLQIELGYPEGKEKEFARFVNNLYGAIDIVMAAFPGIGGGGLAFRGSHALAVRSWRSLPNEIKLRIAKEVAKLMGWSIDRALESANVFFSQSNEGSNSNQQPQFTPAQKARIDQID